MYGSPTSQEATTFLEFLGVIRDPVIEGLTIVLAGYGLFLLERRARRKEIAILVESLLIKCAAIIISTFKSKPNNEISSISKLLQLRPAYNEFGRISDKIGILGNELVDNINSLFLKIQIELIDIEWQFRSIGPTGLQLAAGADFDALNQEAAIYMSENWDTYEKMTIVLGGIGPALAKITGSDQNELIIDVKRWAPRKAELEKLLANHKDKEPPGDDQEEADD